MIVCQKCTLLNLLPQPADRLIEITDDLASIKSELSDTTLTKLALPRHDQPITNEILLRDIRCLRQQILQVVPQLKIFVSSFFIVNGSLRIQTRRIGLVPKFRIHILYYCNLFASDLFIQYCNAH